MEKALLKEYVDAIYILEQSEDVKESEIIRAEEIRQQVETFLGKQTMRVQRIFKHKYIQGLSWEKVAKKMGRGCTSDSVRQELYRAIRECDTS